MGYCPWCGRWDSLVAPDGVSIGIVCRTRRFRGAEVSCLWGAWQLRGITSRSPYQRQAPLLRGIINTPVVAGYNTLVVAGYDTPVVAGYAPVVAGH